MKNIIYALLISALTGCATLTESQIKSVNQFASASTNFSAYPSKIITGLADIRYQRGIYLANSLNTDSLQLAELDHIFLQKIKDESIADDVDISLKIIDRYAQALALLSSDKFVDNLADEAKNLGENLDDLILKNNALPNAKQIPKGIGAAVNQLIVLGGRQYLKSKQAKAIREFVPRGDTLITVISNNLLVFLQSGHIDALIRNEETGLPSSYLSYLRQTKIQTRILTTSNLEKEPLQSTSTTFYKSNIADDKAYLNLKATLVEVKNLRAQTISATKSLVKAHHQLLKEMESKKTLQEMIKELREFGEETNGLRATLKKLN